MTLSAEDMAALKLQLEARYAQLREHVRDELMRADSERYTDIAGQVHDAGEESIADMLVEIGLTVVDQQVNELREVESALQRIGTNDFGICQTCGETIGLARLKAQPEASRCMACQMVYEGSGVQGSPSL